MQLWSQWKYMMHGKRIWEKPKMSKNKKGFLELDLWDAALDATVIICAILQSILASLSWGAWQPRTCHCLYGIYEPDLETVKLEICPKTCGATYSIHKPKGSPQIKLFADHHHPCKNKVIQWIVCFFYFYIIRFFKEEMDYYYFGLNI